MIPLTDDGAPMGYEEQAAEWCWRIADRALTDPEQAQFDAWIRADPRHQQVFDEMVAVWKGTDTIAEMPGFLSLRAKALTTMESARDRDEVSSYGRSGWFRAFAAVAAILLMALGGLWFFADGADVYGTGIGERRIVRLEDGSRISLDASSRVVVAYSDDRRALRLERGRAKFDVAKDPLRPFTVAAGNQAVVATGTAFSVELLRDQMRVLLYEGEVEVVAQPVAGRVAAAAKTPKPAGAARATEQLLPGQELVSNLSSGAVKVAPAKMDRSLSWEDGRLDFVDEPLARAVERINRYTDTPIVVGDVAAGRLLVNGVFDAGDTQSFVRGMTTLFPLSAKYENSKVTLVSGREPLASK
ncbi:FecR family protein [Sphingomonas sp.]|uniref:FecR family protein n=1 Tax=Sphingomonas sp. TaxID=28214 RepID=UPI002ED8E50B